MRTNISIDDTVIQKALLISGLKTKRAVVEKALKEFIANNTRMNLLELKGKIRFADDYNYKAMREDAP